jgi:hypothetical protein
MTAADISIDEQSFENRSKDYPKKLSIVPIW